MASSPDADRRASAEAALAPDLRQALREAPKVELHLHLDGAMSRTWLLDRVRRGRPETTAAELDRRLTFGTFDEFIRAWVWKCQALDRYQDFESLAESVFEELARQGVVHVEPFLSPGDYRRNGLEPRGVIEAVLTGARRAAAATGLTFGLVVDLIRDHGPAVAAERLEEITPYRADGVIGVGLGGTEVRFPAAPFAEVYAEAARRGFRRTAHAGETAGPDSVRETRERLGAERIGHGVRAIEDAALVAELARDGVALEVCPTSNVRTGAVAGYAVHPLRRLYDAGVRVTVNSDDPTFFGASLTDELERCLTHLGFRPAELAVMAEHAAAATFLDQPSRARLVERVRAGWRALR